MCPKPFEDIHPELPANRSENPLGKHIIFKIFTT
jgi:hypothetical protein